MRITFDDAKTQPWTDSEYGLNETPYKVWRAKLGFGAVIDIDQVEIRYDGDTPHPVALIDIKVPRGGEVAGPNKRAYFDALKRSWGNGSKYQTKHEYYRMLASQLEVPFYVVVHAPVSGNWYVYDDGVGSWVGNYTEEQYEHWLRQL